MSSVQKIKGFQAFFLQGAGGLSRMTQDSINLLALPFAFRRYFLRKSKHLFEKTILGLINLKEHFFKPLFTGFIILINFFKMNIATGDKRLRIKQLDVVVLACGCILITWRVPHRRFEPPCWFLLVVKVIISWQLANWVHKAYACSDVWRMPIHSYALYCLISEVRSLVFTYVFSIGVFAGVFPGLLFHFSHCRNYF